MERGDAHGVKFTTTPTCHPCLTSTKHGIVSNENQSKQDCPKKTSKPMWLFQWKAKNKREIIMAFKHRRKESNKWIMSYNVIIKECVPFSHHQKINMILSKIYSSIMWAMRLSKHHASNEVKHSVSISVIEHNHPVSKLFPHTSKEHGKRGNKKRGNHRRLDVENSQ